MRRLPTSSLLDGRCFLNLANNKLSRRTVTRAILSAPLAAIVGACAKSPANLNGVFTKITFRMKVAGKINTSADDDPSTNYIYIVAFRAATDLNPPSNLAPVPVINSTNPNGRVGGSPTHFVEFNTLQPTSSTPFVLNKFAAGPTADDPTNPTDLAHWSDVTATRGPIVSFVSYVPGTTELQFDLFVNQMADTDILGKALQTLQVQFLTMSRYANFGGGTRAWDALGDQTTPNYVQVDLRRTGHYSNTLSNIELPNDVAGGNDPDLDIVDWSIDVITP